MNRDPAVVEAFKDFMATLEASPLDHLRKQAIGSYLRQAYDIYDGWARIPGRPAAACPHCHVPVDATYGIADVITCGNCGRDLIVMEETL